MSAVFCKVSSLLLFAQGQECYTLLLRGETYYCVSGCSVALVEELECASSTYSCIGVSSPVVGISAVSETDNHSVISVNSLLRIVLVLV